MAGRRSLKPRIRGIAALLLVECLLQQVGLPASSPLRHRRDTGDPGNVKITLVRRRAEIVLQVMENRRDDLVVIGAGAEVFAECLRGRVLQPCRH